MAQFFTRFMKGMVEDVLVERLSNNKAVQRMAVSAVKSAEEAQATLSDPSKVKESASGFFAALKSEIAKDFGGGKTHKT